MKKYAALGFFLGFFYSCAQAAEQASSPWSTQSWQMPSSPQAEVKAPEKKSDATSLPPLNLAKIEHAKKIVRDYFSLREKVVAQLHASLLSKGSPPEVLRANAAARREEDINWLRAFSRTGPLQTIALLQMNLCEF